MQFSSPSLAIIVFWDELLTRLVHRSGNGVLIAEQVVRVQLGFYI